MEYKELITKVCEKTIEEKHTIPGYRFDIFGYVEGKGMYLKDPDYVKKGYQYLDMMYDVWDWQEGVGMYALLEAGKVLKTDRYFEYTREWVEYHIQMGLPAATVNTTAPFLCVLELYKQTKKEYYYNMCEERARYLMEEAKRVENGALQHTVIGVDVSFSSQIWADTLFVAVLFLLKWALLTEDKNCEKEAIKQFFLHEGSLLDTGSGLFFHGYNVMKKSWMSAVHWGRANTWFLLSASLILKELPLENAERARIVESLIRCLKAMRKVQDADGRFHTVLDDKESYTETTAICGFCAALQNLLSENRLEKEEWESTSLLTLQALKEQIAEDGTVLSASGGTPLMCSREEYEKIPSVMSYYGQGLMLFALCAAAEREMR